jgi:hypothetical protein
MKRKEFLKNLAYLTTGVTIVGCDAGLFDEMIDPSKSLGDLSISDAQEWFENVYLKGKVEEPNSRSKIRHRRKADWTAAKKPKNENNLEYGWVWIPMDYLDGRRPGIVKYTEDTKYKLDLKNFYIQPIVEGLIVYKENDEFKSFLGQVAYDPFQIADSSFVIDKEKFTGSLLRADWDDKIIDGADFVDGKLQTKFVNNGMSDAMMPSENARTNSCYYYSIDYTTWYYDEDNVFTIEGWTDWVTVCEGSGPGDIYVHSYGGSSTGSGGSSTGGGAYFDPLAGSGQGSWVMPGNLYNGYNPTSAVLTNGADRAEWHETMEDVAWATGLALNIHTFSIDKAVAFAKTLGLTINSYYPVILRSGQSIGVVGMAISGYQLYMGFRDDGWQWNEDGWNAASLALGFTGVVLATTIAPWVAVAIGAFQIGIAIYTQVNSSNSDNDVMLLEQERLLAVNPRLLIDMPSKIV